MIQSRKFACFYPPIWVIIQLNRATTAVWHVHAASRLTSFCLILVTAIGGKPKLPGRLRCSR